MDLSIPNDYMPAVTRGLNEAFGVDRVDDVRDLTERAGSNRAFRIQVGGTAYLLRINTRRGDTVRHFACMRAAAEAGLAPRVLYADAADRVSITDFLGATPLRAEDALRRVPRLLRQLHALNAFPAAPFNTTCTFLLQPGPAFDGFLGRFRSSDSVNAGDVDWAFASCARLIEVYSSLTPDPVPSHNDLFKPDNMLFDGNRLWLVDWEAAFQNDRYADLAAVANMLAPGEVEERLFLEEYNGGMPPTPYQSARLFLMRQLAHLFYAAAFLPLSAAASEAVPSYAEYQRRFWQREVGLADDGAKVLYGLVHWQELLASLRSPRFEHALAVVSA